MQEYFITEAVKNSKGKKYKCPYCDHRDYKEPLVKHIDKEHKIMIPKGFTSARLVFNIANKKDHGTCVCGCGKETAWREDLWRYDRYATDKCKEKYSKEMKQRMVKIYGKEHLLNDADMQNKMLSGRSISGVYKFSTGGKKEYVGTYEEKFLEFCDKVLNLRCSDIEQPGPVIEYKWNDETHFWITDYYIPAFNLVLDIKDGGSNPNTRDMEDYRAKQNAKESAIANTGKYNYLRLTDNNFAQLMLIMAELKLRMIDDNSSEYEPIISINEATPPLETILTTNPFQKEMTLYHGSPEKLDIINPIGYNGGTKLSRIRMSSFWCDTTGICKVISIGRIISKYNKNLIWYGDPDCIHLLVLESERKELHKAVKNKSIFIYEKTVPKEYIGIGHSAYGIEYTIDVPVRPDSYVEYSAEDILDEIAIYCNSIDEIEGIKCGYNKSKYPMRKLITKNKYRKDIKNTKKIMIGEAAIPLDNSGFDHIEIKADSKDGHIMKMLECMIGITPQGKRISDVYVVNYMRQGTFEDILGVSIGDPGHPNFSGMLTTDSDGEITMNHHNILDEAVEGKYKLYKFIGERQEAHKPMDIVEYVTGVRINDTSELDHDPRFKKVLPYDQMMEFEEKCLESTILQPDSVTIMTEAMLNNDGIESRIDKDGVFIINTETGLRTPSYPNEAYIKDYMINYIKGGKI